MSNISTSQIFAGLVGLLIALLLFPLIGTLVGAFCGGVVGFFFPGTVGLVGSAIAGGAVLPAWQVGAILGFVSGFFKTRVTNQAS